jgi:hypothetical protein
MIADLVHDPKEQIQYLRNQAIGEKNILHWLAAMRLPQPVVPIGPTPPLQP